MGPMQVIRDFLHSEKGTAIGALVFGATILAATGEISVAEWMEYTKWMAAVYVAGKTMQGSAKALAESRKGCGFDVNSENGQPAATGALESRVQSGDTILE